MRITLEPLNARVKSWRYLESMTVERTKFKEKKKAGYTLFSIFLTKAHLSPLLLFVRMKFPSPKNAFFLHSSHPSSQQLLPTTT